MQPRSGRALDEAYALPDAALAEHRLTQLTAGLEQTPPGVASSLRKGLVEKLSAEIPESAQACKECGEIFHGEMHR